MENVFIKLATHCLQKYKTWLPSVPWLHDVITQPDTSSPQKPLVPDSYDVTAIIRDVMAQIVMNEPELSHFSVLPNSLMPVSLIKLQP